MIETTYVRLGKAAVELQTDEDTLLIAAIENKITLCGLLSGEVRADGVEVIDGDYADESKRRYHPDGLAYPDFVVLEPREVASLLRFNECPVRVFNAQGVWWEVDPAKHELPRVQRKDIFITRTELGVVKTRKKLIGSGPSEKPADISSRAKNTQLNIIGCLLELIKSGIDEHGKAISTYTTQEQIIGYLEDQFPLVFGLKKTNLENTFAQANKTLREARNPK